MEVKEVDLGVKIEGEDIKEESIFEGMYEIKEENESIEGNRSEMSDSSSNIETEDESTKKYFNPIKLEKIVDENIIALSRNEEDEYESGESENLIVNYTEGTNCGRDIEKETLLKNKQFIAKPSTSTNKEFGPFICDECKASFKWKSQLKSHIRTNSSKSDFNGAVCLKKQLSIKRYIRIHTESKPFKCDTCDRRFTISSDLKKHVRIHTGNEPFKCDTCDKTFSHSSSLKTHIRTHSGTKPFKCDTCDKRFSQNQNLERHIRIHSGSKPFKCDACDKRFSVNSSLKRHIRIHSGSKPFQCDTCDKTFSDSTNFKNHIIIHSGSKPFQCDICDKRFSRSSNLKSHIRIHTRSKRFKCDICVSSFARKSSLTKHIKIHNKNK